MENLKGFEDELKLRGLSRQTLDAYLYANSRFLKFIKKPPKNVTSRDIKRYIHYLIDSQKKPKTINLIIAALKSYYDEHRGRKLFTRIKRLKLEKKIPNVLSRQELTRMINGTTNEKHRLMIEFLYSTGVRAGELINVKVSDLDIENRYVRIIFGKGKKDRLTILSVFLCKELKEYLMYKPNNTYLFESTRGGKLTVRTVEEIVKKASNEIKRRVYPHALRASFATHLYDNGTQLQKIQKLMGHSHWKTTQEYVNSSTVDISGIENPLDKIKKEIEN